MVRIPKSINADLYVRNVDGDDDSLVPDAATQHAMQLARQAFPLGLAVSDERMDEPPSIPSLMIRNVPTLYTPDELRSDLQLASGLVGGIDYDFLYLPLNAKKRRRNRGYAFLNLRTTRAVSLIVMLHNTYLPRHGPPLRPLGICASDVQGFDANWRHFAHVFRETTYAKGTRSSRSDWPLFWKDGKEMETDQGSVPASAHTASSNGVDSLWDELSISANVLCASFRFCVMCGAYRRSPARFCVECGIDLLAYCSQCTSSMTDTPTSSPTSRLAHIEQELIAV